MSTSEVDAASRPLMGHRLDKVDTNPDPRLGCSFGDIILGLYGNNGKLNGNNYLGFRV